MDKLQVMYISNESEINGAMWSMVDMLAGLKEYINPIVILPSNGIAETLLIKKRIPYYVVPFSVTYGKIGNGTQDISDKIFFDNYQAAVRIADIIEDENIQIIHSNSIVVNVGAMAAVMKAVPHIWHIRELLEEDFDCELYDKEWTCRLFEQTDRFISISKCVKGSWLKKYNIDSEQLYDGLEISRYMQDIDCLSCNEHTFLLAGRIDQGKGQWDAVKAVEILRRDGEKDIKLVMIGNGSKKYVWAVEKYIAERKLEKNISIIPAQNDISVFRKKSQFSLTTSKMEALGRVTIEALLAGNITIGANTGGTLELLEVEQKYGYLYRQGDPVDLARVMREVMKEDIEKKRKLKIKAQKFAIEQFGNKEYAKKILKIYEIALQKKRCIDRQDCLSDMNKRYQSLLNRSSNIVRFDKQQEYKWKQQFLLYERWIRLKQKGYALSAFFEKNNIRIVAIYGMGYIGCDLYDELEGSEINVSYFIDRTICDFENVIKVVHPDGVLDKVDAIVVTVINKEEEIKAYLKKRCSYVILSLYEIVNWIEANASIFSIDV